MEASKILQMLSNLPNENYSIYGNPEGVQFEQYVKASEENKIFIIFKENGVKKYALIINNDDCVENCVFLKFVRNNIIEIKEDEFEEAMDGNAGFLKAPFMINTIKSYISENKNSFKVNESNSLNQTISNSELTYQLSTSPRTSLKTLTIRQNQEDFLIIEEMSETEIDKVLEIFKPFEKTLNNSNTL